MSKTSLSAQRQAMEHVIAYCRNDVEDTILKAAQDGCLSLSWFDRRAELVRELDRLNREAGYLAELFQMFPRSQVNAVRFRCPKCAETMIDDQYEIGRDA